MTNTKNTDIAQYINYLLDCIRAEMRVANYYRSLVMTLLYRPTPF